MREAEEKKISRSEAKAIFSLVIFIIVFQIFTLVVNKYAPEESTNTTAVEQSTASTVIKQTSNTYKDSVPVISNKSNNYKKKAGNRIVRITKDNTPYGKKTDKKLKKKEIDINTADSATLTTIYGIGPYFAQKIIKYRERLGGSFVSIFQLQEIYGIDSAKFNIIKKQIKITGPPKKFSLSEAEFKQLAKNPYIGNKTAKKIIQFRMENGCNECNLQNLLKANIIDSLQVEQLKNYIIE